MNKLTGSIAGLMVLGASSIGAADAVRASSAGPRDFIGLWEGVDPLDGSLTQRAITCDHDDVCEVLGSDQFFSFCVVDEGEGREILQGRGFLQGSGTIEDGVLVLPGFVLTCADGRATPAFPTTFTLDPANGTLIEDTDGPPPTIVFHRLSPKLGRR